MTTLHQRLMAKNPRYAAASAEQRARIREWHREHQQQPADTGGANSGNPELDAFLAQHPEAASIYGGLQDQSGGNQFGTQADAAPKYQIVNGEQIGRDNNYSWAVYPNGKVEPVYMQTVQRLEDPSNPMSMTSIIDPTTAKTASELKAMGIQPTGVDAHGVPTFGGGYNAYGRSTSGNNRLGDVLGTAALAAGTAFVGSGGAIAAGADGMSAADAYALGDMTGAPGITQGMTTGDAFTLGDMTGGTSALTNTAGNTLMPPAIPEVDPTFGNTLTQTGPGQYENVGNIETFGTPTVPAGTGTPYVPPVDPTNLDPTGDPGPDTTPGGTDNGPDTLNPNDPNYPGEPTGYDGGPTGLPLPGDLSLWTSADWSRLLGSALPGLLGAYGANELGNSLHDIGQQQQQNWDTLHNERLPFLHQGTKWMNHPNSYFAGPGQAAVNSTLRGLSVNGNPFGSGTSLALASEAGLNNWQDAWSKAGAIGTGTPMAPTNTPAMMGAQADASGLNAIGYGLGNYFNPVPSFADFMKQFKYSPT